MVSQRCFPASDVVAARRRYPGSISLTSPAIELRKILNVEITCRKFLCNTDSTVFIESTESLGLYSVQPIAFYFSPSHLFSSFPPRSSLSTQSRSLFKPAGSKSKASGIGKKGFKFIIHRPTVQTVSKTQKYREVPNSCRPELQTADNKVILKPYWTLPSR